MKALWEKFIKWLEFPIVNNGFDWDQFFNMQIKPEDKIKKMTCFAPVFTVSISGQSFFSFNSREDMREMYAPKDGDNQIVSETDDTLKIKYPDGTVRIYHIESSILWF